jgi:serine/threonine-protein kinase
MPEITSRLSAAVADRYRIERRLGEGGMATVYLAEDLKHKRNVAIKVLRPELAAVLGAERFVQEITTTASLQHPHILPLYDSGETDGFLYYVMPYIEGETLRSKLDRERQLGVEEAITIARDVADALDYAHRRGVIHRDIKPDNILLHDGRPMVADFGIALAVSAAAGGRMTETGLSLGTPHYMSPEQATAEKDISARSDVYSLATVLYEMLAGAPPHLGGTAQQIIMKIVGETAAPVTALLKSVPPNVTAALARALEKIPADRFESARAFTEALADPTFTVAAIQAGGLGNTPARRPNAVGTVVLVGALLVAAAWGWLRPWGQEVDHPAVRFAIIGDSGHAPLLEGIAISLDGSLVVYPGTYGTGPALYRRGLADLDAQLIAGTEGGVLPFLSPDGTQLAFAVGNELRVMPLGGGTARTVATFTGSAISGAWSESGVIVFSTWGPSAAYLIDLNSGAVRSHEVLERMGGGLGVYGLHFVRGTDALLFAGYDVTRAADPEVVARLSDGPLATAEVGTGNEAARGLYALPSVDDTVPQWIGVGESAWYVQSGHLVSWRLDGALYVEGFDVGTLTLEGNVVRLTDQAAVPGGLLRPLVDVSLTGAVVYNTAPTARELTIVDRTGAGTVLLDDRLFWVPRFSPDGSRIVYGTQGTEVDVWMHDLNGGTTERLTFDGFGNNDPVWSPDGRRIAFSRSEARKDLFALTVGGTDRAFDTLLVADGTQWTTDWSPDGRSIVFTSGDAGNEDILALSVAGHDEPYPVVATPASEGAGRISPDGQWLAYHSDESGRLEVYVQAFPVAEARRQISVDGGRDPMWGPDGSELFYWIGGLAPEVSGSWEHLGAAQLAFRDGVSVVSRDTLFHFPGYVGGAHAGYDVHPDGDRFVIVRTPTTGRVVVTLNSFDRR